MPDMAHRLENNIYFKIKGAFGYQTIAFDGLIITRKLHLMLYHFVYFLMQIGEVTERVRKDLFICDH